VIVLFCAGIFTTKAQRHEEDEFCALLCLRVFVVILLGATIQQLGDLVGDWAIGRLGDWAIGLKISQSLNLPIA
jgi:hypothetical protein